MNNQETIDHLEGLKLKGMAQTFKGSLNMPIQERPTAEQLVGKMAEAELFNRNQRRTEMYLKTSCGKSYLACALGRQACYLGYRVEYFSMNKFV